MTKEMMTIPGLNYDEIDEDPGLITSDSNFEIAAGEGPGEDNEIVPVPKISNNVRKNVSKTFKKMLNQNNARGGVGIENFNDVESTKYGGS